jgi:hypothetical protein
MEEKDSAAAEATAAAALEAEGMDWEEEETAEAPEGAMG